MLKDAKPEKPEQTRTPTARPVIWGAINTALYAETVGIMKMLFSLNIIKDQLKTSATLDPKIAHSGAYHLGND